MRAVERLKSEITANISAIDTNLPEITGALGTANRGLDALQTCADSATNVAAVNAGLDDDRLVKSFFTWTRWQTNLPVMSREARERLAATQAFLAQH